MSQQSGQEEVLTASYMQMRCSICILDADGTGGQRREERSSSRRPRTEVKGDRLGVKCPQSASRLRLGVLFLSRQTRVTSRVFD